MSKPRAFYLALFLSLAGCPSPPPGRDAGDAAPGDAPDATVEDAAPDARVPQSLTEVPQTEAWDFPGLEAEAWVVRTPGGVPHIYAANRRDLARVQGFTIARDRFFMLDMERRLALGTLSSLLGDAALNTDMQSRMTGMTFVVERILANAGPDQLALLDAFAQGINAYIDQVRANRLPPGSEYALAASTLGRPSAVDAMERYTRRDVAAMLGTIVYNLGFETGDAGRGATARALPGLFMGAPLGDLRRAGAERDIFERVSPARPVASAGAGFGLETSTGDGGTGGGMGGGGAPRGFGDLVLRDPLPGLRDRRLPREMLDTLTTALDQIRVRLHREEGFGSNAWAVRSTGTRDGRALLAGDGHLSLSVPSLFYQIGLDTEVLGRGDIHQVGLTIPGIPLLAVGTNGRVAWCQTQLFNDITDWYAEQITLDAQGAPAASRFNGMDRPLVRVEETYTVANVPMLNSMGRTERWPRWTTFDGRWITAIEGRSATPGAMLRPGETLVRVLGGYVVPGDTDGDGVVSAVSFDYAGFDMNNVLGVLDGFGRANNVREFREATRGLVAYSQNIVAADSSGSVLYTSYQAQPCRNYLARNMDRTWAPGSDPRRLLDGTRYGGFRIPTTADGLRVDEAAGAMDPYACVVPFDRIPQSLDPARGWVQTANNDPGGMSLDNSLTNDAFYVGGPWLDGYRAERIEQLLREAHDTRMADEERMAQIQADFRSPLGAEFTPALLDAIDRARTAAAGTPDPSSEAGRLAARYRAAMADYDEVARRLRAWGAAGYLAHSGVETSYHALVPGERESAVATMIFNAWVGRFISGTFDDEMFPGGLFDPLGSASRVRTLKLMVDGRGTNSTQLASYNPATGESAFFDVLSTPQVETSREVMLDALDRALAFLRSMPTMPATGGFGTNDMNQWLWGMRHTVRFDSIIADFLGDNPMLRFLVDMFSITPRQISLAENLTPDDPRSQLRGFPRPGDQFGVDAANPGFSGTRFSYGSGPSFRMVFALGPTRTTGRNVIPGGQSGLTRSRNFADQAALWLGNRTLPVQLAPADVAAAATGREVFRPMR